MKGDYHRILLSIAVLYCVVSTFLYLSDPLALSPQLDAKENLILSSQIDQGTLAPEPFYRAMVYPAILSLFHPAEARPLLGLLFGLACHLANGAMVYFLARKTWGKPVAGLISAVLYLVHPASLFFALQLFDISFAITLFLGGLSFELLGREGKVRSLVSGLLLGLAALTRPHFLPVILLAPAILSLWPGKRIQGTAFAWIPVLTLFLLQGMINQGISGEFRMLPWQGSYNLWAANRPGANGLYFKQVLDMSSRGDNMNPAKAESIALFARNHPETQPPYSIDDMNAYWKSRFREHLKTNPLDALKLFLYKGYAVINSREQYNNLSFPFHRDRLPWLRYNPLCWGFLLVTGMLSFVFMFRENKPRAMLFVLLIAAYAATLVLFYASARFRLPLVPLLAILSGGAFHFISAQRWKPAFQAGMLALAGVIVFLTFSAFSGIRRNNTFIQDELLLANANADLGRDLEAARMARQILEQHPNRQEAQRIYTISYFNLRLLQDPAASLLGNWQDQKPLVIQSPPTDPVQDSILGIYYWTWGQHDQARLLWENISQSNPSGSRLAEACLKLTSTPQTPSRKMLPLQEALQPILFESSTPVQP